MKDDIGNELWELFYKELYRFHFKELQKLSEKEQIKYIEDMTELEYKIYMVCSINGIPNRSLCFHKDFPEVFKRITNKKILLLKIKEIKEKENDEIMRIDALEREFEELDPEQEEIEKDIKKQMGYPKIRKKLKF